MKTYLKCFDLWEIVESGYEEPTYWINIEGEERKREKQEQHQNCLALMELKKGIKFNIFPLISSCKIVCKIWRILVERFDNIEIKNACEHSTHDDFVDKNYEPLCLMKNYV